MWRAGTGDAYRQILKKRCRIEEFYGDVSENLRRSVDGQGFESTDGMRDSLEEGVIGTQTHEPPQLYGDGRGF